MGLERKSFVGVWGFLPRMPHLHSSWDDGDRFGVENCKTTVFSLNLSENGIRKGKKVI